MQKLFDPKPYGSAPPAAVLEKYVFKEDVAEKRATCKVKALYFSQSVADGELTTSH